MLLNKIIYFVRIFVTKLKTSKIRKRFFRKALNKLADGKKADGKCFWEVCCWSSTIVMTIVMIGISKLHQEESALVHCFLISTQNSRGNCVRGQSCNFRWKDIAILSVLYVSCDPFFRMVYLYQCSSVVQSSLNLVFFFLLFSITADFLSQLLNHSLSVC